MDDPAVQYPELKKLQAIPEERRGAVQGFIDWFFDEPDNDRIRQQGAGEAGRRDLMARFFGIDMDKVAAEQDALVRRIHEEQNG